MALKIAHFATFSPHRCGLYGTARELILAERLVGIDAEMIDIHIEKGKFVCTEGLEDNGIITVGMAWANDADIFVKHSAIPKKLRDSDKPKITILHGRPENSFLLNVYGKMPTLNNILTEGTDKRFDAFVTLWDEHVFKLSRFIPKEKLFYVPAMVDTDFYKPEGKKHDFKNENGKPNIIIADAWREDVTPYNILMASARFRAKYCPEAKIHLYGIPKNPKDSSRRLCTAMKKRDGIGDIFPLVLNIGDVYRAGDILVTPHRIATRIIREALACGLPIVAGSGCPYTPFTADSRDEEKFTAEIMRCWTEVSKKPQEYRRLARQMACEKFNLKQTGEVMLDVFAKTLKIRQAKEDEWKRGDGLKSKKYKTYEAYVEHQKSKLDKGISWLASYDVRYVKYLDNIFVKIQGIKGKSVLCLGSRTGSEVKAFLDAGCFAVGIDLNPGKDNKYVVTVDFHQLEQSDNSVDVVYTNSLDHCFDFRKVMSEIKRVVKPDGRLFVVLSKQGNDDYATLEWKNNQTLIALIEKKGFVLKQTLGGDVPLGFDKFLCFDKIQSNIPATPGSIERKTTGLKLAMIYNPEDTKLRSDSYSKTYRHMFDALRNRFGTVQKITENCNSKDIDADCIMFFDPHSSHEIEIEGIANHQAVKYSYFDDPHQRECKARYGKSIAIVHKLGPKQRIERARKRGIQHIICPYRDGFHRYFDEHLGSNTDGMLLWFPISPSTTHYRNRARLLKDREKTVLANGAKRDGGMGCYNFRKLAFANPEVKEISHWFEDKRTPVGDEYPDFLSQYAGALAVMDFYPVPKYFEIPLAGCVCFAQHHPEYEELGFKDGINCIYVNKNNLSSSIKDFKARVDQYQSIADAGRELVEDNWTAAHFADYIYNHAARKLKAPASVVGAKQLT